MNCRLRADCNASPIWVKEAKNCTGPCSSRLDQSGQSCLQSWALVGEGLTDAVAPLVSNAQDFGAAVIGPAQLLDAMNNVFGQPSTHQEPDNETAYSYTFKELSPSQSIGVELKRPHHQIENLFALST